MSTVTRRKAATYEDLLAVPDHMVAEILDGDLFAFPRPGFRHARAASTLGGDLQSRFDHPPGGGDTPGGWWILDEPELHLREDIVVPDVAGWRRERVPLLPDAPWFDVAPDWVCEVLSPSTETVDRGRKLRIYAREEVSHLWLLNPRLQDEVPVEDLPEGYERLDVPLGSLRGPLGPLSAESIDGQRKIRLG